MIWSQQKMRKFSFTNLKCQNRFLWTSYCYKKFVVLNPCFKCLRCIAVQFNKQFQTSSHDERGLSQNKTWPEIWSSLSSVAEINTNKLAPQLIQYLLARDVPLIYLQAATISPSSHTQTQIFRLQNKYLKAFLLPFFNILNYQDFSTVWFMDASSMWDNYFTTGNNLHVFLLYKLMFYIHIVAHETKITMISTMYLAKMVDQSKFNSEN